ncbi:MAG: hypothetical protein PHN82_11385 [bacterium]|nr:hypothetical protein [bacterium]
MNGKILLRRLIVHLAACFFLGWALLVTLLTAVWLLLLWGFHL